MPNCDTENQRCEQCAYWHDIKGTGVMGECQRYPPQVYWDHNSNESDSSFPSMAHYEWCGEWVEGAKH